VLTNSIRSLDSKISIHRSRKFLDVPSRRSEGQKSYYVSHFELDYITRRVLNPGIPTHHTQIRVFQKEVNIAANCIGEMLAIDERPSLDI
jgi:hypothetical protein